MAGKSDYGPKLSDEEYEREIIALHEELPPMPSREQDRRTRRRELYLAIDHRLGTEFPADRREQLWAIMQQVERKRVRVALKYFLKYLFGRSSIPKGLASDMHGVAGFLVDAFSTVLSESDLRRYFDLEPGERPALPLPNTNDDQ